MSLPDTVTGRCHDQGVTIDDFEAAYAQRRGVSVDTLRERKLYARPCHCEHENCTGWTMARLGPPLRIEVPESRLADLQARTRSHDDRDL